MTARDSQRKKVYDAENMIDHLAGEPMELADIQKMVDKIMGTRWLQVRYPRALNGRVKVLDGRGRRNACGTVAAIKLPSGGTNWSRRPLIFLHELAHSITFRHYGDPYNGVAVHGKEFCSVYLALVRRWYSREVADELKEQFKSRKVKHIARSKQ